MPLLPSSVWAFVSHAGPVTLAPSSFFSQQHSLLVIHLRLKIEQMSWARITTSTRAKIVMLTNNDV